MPATFDLTRKAFGQPRDVSPVDSALRDRVPASLSKPSSAGTATWGRASTLSYGNARDYSSGPFPEVLGGLAASQQVEVYNEIYRQEKPIRVFGSTGAYVDFARTEEIAFKAERQGQYQPIKYLRMKKMPNNY
jgi:hypothetical protein